MLALKKVICVTSIGFLFFASFAWAYTSPGKPIGHVNDFSKVLANDARERLEEDLRAYAGQKGHEIVVVTIPSLNGDDIAAYANTLFREWGIGSKQQNNGILFVVSTADRKMRIEVGYGLEGAVTDVETKHILDDVVRPYFRQNDYSTGIVKGVETIKQAAAEELYVNAKNKKSGLKMNMDTFSLLIFLVFGIFSWLGSVLGRSKSWWAGGGWQGWDHWGNWRNHGGGGGGFGGFGGGSSGGGGSSSSW